MGPIQRSERLKSADVLRGILILGVVFVHMLMLGKVVDSTRSVSLFIQPPYLGLMGFFVITGYFIPSGSYAQRVGKRLKLLMALVVCSIVLPVAMYLWLWVLGQPSTVDDLWLSIVASFGNQNLFEPLSIPNPNKVCFSAYAQYFLWVIFWAFLILYAIADRVLADLRLFAVTLIVLLASEAFLVFMGMRLPFYATLFPIAVAFMLAGAFLSRRRYLEGLEVAGWRSPRTWAPLVLSVCALVVLIYLFPPGARFNFSDFGEYGGMSAFPFFVEGMLVFVVLSYVSVLVARIPLLSDAIALCGKHCLALALLHVFVVRVVLALFYTMPDDLVFPPLPAVQMVMLGVFDVVLIVAVCVLIDRKRAGRSGPASDE